MRHIVEQLKAIDLKSIDLQGIDKKRASTAAATLAIALGTGYYMQRDQPLDVVAQSEPAPAVQVQTASVVPSVAPAAPANAPSASMSEAPDTSLATAAELEKVPASTPATEKEYVVVEDDYVLVIEAVDTPAVTPKIQDDIQIAALGDAPIPVPTAPAEQPVANACDAKLTGTAQDMAMINLSISAPCFAATEIEFSHSGLRFTERLDANGKAEIDLPALEVNAKIVAHLADDSTAEITMTVPDAGQYRRAVLVWYGATGLQLHAFEKGAGYGEPGHMWAEAPGDLARSKSGLGGYVSMLGSVSQGYASDVYTFPAYLMRSVSGPEISIEAQVLETTCDTPVKGTFLRSNGKEAPTEMPVSISAPGCDAVGEYLVLRNLPNELTIALN